MDLRALNKCVAIDHFPLLNITEMVFMLHGAKFYSTLHLTAAYLQIRLHPDSKGLTTFITHFGTFRFVLMSFGLVSAAAEFKRVIYKLFGSME